MSEEDYLSHWCISEKQDTKKSLMMTKWMLWRNGRLQVEKLICYYSNTKGKCCSKINRHLAMDWMKSKEVESIQHKVIGGEKNEWREKEMTMVLWCANEQENTVENISIEKENQQNSLWIKLQLSATSYFRSFIITFFPLG